MTHWHLCWCQSSVHPWHPLHLYKITTSPGAKFNDSSEVTHTHTHTHAGKGFKKLSMQILGSELILNVLSLNSLILQVCLLSWHQLRNWLYATCNLVPMLLPGQTFNSPARRISALPTNSFPTPIAQICARSQRMRKGSSPPGILRRREGLAGLFFHGADCARTPRSHCVQSATRPGFTGSQPTSPKPRGR